MHLAFYKHSEAGEGLKGLHGQNCYKDYIMVHVGLKPMHTEFTVNDVTELRESAGRSLR